MMLDLALSYTPPGSELSVTLATVRDATLLTAALRIAIAEAQDNAIHASDQLAARGFRTKAAYLHRCLVQLADGEEGKARLASASKVVM